MNWIIESQNLFEHISGSSVLNVTQFVFVVCSSKGLPKYIKTEVRSTCFNEILFKRTRRGVKWVSLLSFLHDFWRKLFLMVYSINWISFTTRLPCWHIRQYFYCCYLFISLWRHNFWAVSSWFPIWLRSQFKHLHILRTKEAFNIKWKEFFIIFIFIIFKSLSAVTNWFRCKSGSSSDPVLGIAWQNFFSNDKNFSLNLLFGGMLEQNLIKKVINN